MALRRLLPLLTQEAIEDLVDLLPTEEPMLPKDRLMLHAKFLHDAWPGSRISAQWTYRSHIGESSFGRARQVVPTVP